MSQPCAITSCKRTSRALCHCCKQNLCRNHLIEHDDLLNSQLNPLADEINVLGDRLTALDVSTMFGNAREKLDQWRIDCHEKIDHFFEQKCRELDDYVTEMVGKQRENCSRMQSKLAGLIREQEATREDIDLLTRTIRNAERELREIEQSNFQIDVRPLVIDDNLVRIEKSKQYQFDLSALSSGYRTIIDSNDNRKKLAGSETSLLIYYRPNLCLFDRELTIIKQDAWIHSDIYDMCWSSALARFIVITKSDVFLVGESTMSIERIHTIQTGYGFRCTCSDTSLFVSTYDLKNPSFIYEFSLVPSVAFVKQWRSPDTCKEEEIIGDMVYYNSTIALIIRNRSNNTISMELRSPTTLERLWSLQLEIVSKFSSVRCCSLNCDEWLLIDINNQHLIHVTKDGKMNATRTYQPAPLNACLFGSNMLVVATENGINCHKL